MIDKNGTQPTEWTTPGSNTAMQVAQQWLAISDTVMTSGLTKHWAFRDRINPDWWWVTWLPAGQVCDRNQAITAMTIAMHTAMDLASGQTLDEVNPRWPLLVTWAAELGMSAAQAVRLASAQLPAAAPGAYVNPNGQIQDTKTGAWRYVSDGYAAARNLQLAELRETAGVAR